MRGKLDCFGLTDVGKLRPVNEDQFLIADLNKSLLVRQTSLSDEDHTRLFGGTQGQLLLVADGMGGHAAGRQASTIAVQSLERYMLNTMSWFFQLDERSNGAVEEQLKHALTECQRSIEAAASIHPERQGMGTTLTMAYILWPVMYVVHVGDSRCYLLRESGLEQITTDHTVAQQMVERGAIAADAAQHSRWSHVLWNCVGGGSHELSTEIHQAELELGDIVLLCTDGLTANLSDERMLDLLLSAADAEEACRELIDAANELGGPDNITAVVARFQPADEAAQADVLAVEEPADEAAAAGWDPTEDLPREAVAAHRFN